jgi:zinc transport system substrate-binding protein
MPSKDHSRKSAWVPHPLRSKGWGMTPSQSGGSPHPFLQKGRGTSEHRLCKPVVGCAAFLAICLASVALLSAGCEPKAAVPDAQKKTLVVYTTFYPTMYFTQRIAGDHAKVVCPCPATEDPAYWMPDDKTLIAYKQADLIIINGASFEKWLDKVSLPQSRIVDTTTAQAGSLITFTQAVQHAHGPKGEHTHAGIDGHTWLDPVIAKAQAEEIKKALIRRDPDHAAAFERGFGKLAKDLDDLDARLRAVSARMKTVSLLCSHPAYNYLARQYGWRIRNLHLDPRGMPDAEALAEAKQAAVELSAQHLLWETAPASDITKAIHDATGVRSIVFSPCATLGEDVLQRGGDYISAMQANVAALEKALIR